MSPTSLNVVHGILAGDSSARAGALHVGRIDVGIAEQAPHQRRQQRAAGRRSNGVVTLAVSLLAGRPPRLGVRLPLWRCLSFGCRRRLFCSGLRRGLRFLRFGRLRRDRLVCNIGGLRRFPVISLVGFGTVAFRYGALPDDGDHRAHIHGVALFGAQFLEGAGYWGWHFGIDLVGGHLEQNLVLRHLVARLLEPAGDGSLGDGLAQLGHGDVGHVECSCDVRFVV